MSTTIAPETTTAETTTATETAAPPTPQELRSGAIFRDPARRDAWLGTAATPDVPSTEGEAAPPATRERRADGTFAPKAGEATAAATTETASTETGEETPDAKAKPERERGVPVELLDAEGKPVALDLATTKVRAKMGGEVVELPVADLVRRVQSTAGAEQRAARAETLAREATQMYAQERAELTETIDELRAMAREYLTNPAARERDLAELEKYESPERVAERERQGRERAERELTTERTQHANQRQIDAFYAEFGGENGVVDHQNKLLEQYPHVSAEELVGRFNVDLERLQLVAANGKIPPEKLPQLRAYLRDELPAFCRQRHEERAGRLRSDQEDARKREEAAAAERDRARAESQRAKNDLATATRPSGAAGIALGQAAPPKPRTLAEATASALSAAKQATRV